jgi:hypothetical protein
MSSSIPLSGSLFVAVGRVEASPTGAKSQLCGLKLCDLE